jgi:hypothetical protein
VELVVISIYVSLNTSSSAKTLIARTPVREMVCGKSSLLAVPANSQYADETPLMFAPILATNVIDV